MSQSSENQHQINYRLYVVLSLFWLLVALIVLNAEWLRSACVIGADFVLSAIEVERAKSFEALYGPYSRTGVRHPSPVYFYLYALGGQFFAFFPSYYSVYLMTQAFLNFVLLGLALLFLPAQLQRKTQAGLYMMLLFLIVRKEGKDILFSIWGPATAIVPAAAFIVTAAATSRGNVRALPACVFSAIMLGSNHFGTLPLIVTVLFVAALSGHANRERGRPLWPVFLSIALLFGAAFPVAYEYAVLGPESNVFRLMQFGSNAKVNLTYLSATRFVGMFYAMPFRWFGQVPPFLALGGVCLGLLMSAVYWRKKGGGQGDVLCGFILLAIAVSIFSATRIDHVRYHFLMWWQHGIVAVALWVVLSPIFSWLAELGKRWFPPIFRDATDVVLGVFISCSIAYLISVTFVKERIVCRGEPARMANALALSQKKNYAISMHDPKLWKAAASLSLELHRRKIPHCVQKARNLFGTGLTCPTGKGEAVRRIHLFPAARSEELRWDSILFKNRKVVITLDPQL